MSIDYKYYKKIPFEFDRQRLIDIANVYLEGAEEGYVDSEGNEIPYGSFYQGDEENPDAKPPVSLYFKDIPEDFRHLKIFNDCYKLFANTIYKELNGKKQYHDLDSVYNYAQIFKIDGPLLPHKDTRTASFSIPLYGVEHPVCWYDDDGNVLEKHTYDGPTLINTGIKHGCMDNIGERVFFQVGGFAEPFNEIAESI